MAWMRFQTREGNRLDLWMLRQILGHGKRIAGVTLQAEVQGLKALQEQEAVENIKKLVSICYNCFNMNVQSNEGYYRIIKIKKNCRVMRESLTVTQ